MRSPIGPKRGPVARPLIAHVVYRFDVGGLENGVVNLINRLPPDRYDHAIVALTDITDFRRRITRDRVAFHALGKPPGHGTAIFRDLFRLFRTMRPTIVHTRNIAAAEAQISAALARVPMRVHGEHGWDLQDVAGGRRSHHWQRRFLRPLIHRHVALSGEIRRYLENRIGVPPEEISQICNGVDVARFVPREPGARCGPIGLKFGHAEKFFVIGTVGRLAPVKHQRLLIDAFARACAILGNHASHLRLVVVGDGPDRAMLQARVAASGVAERVWLAGSRDDVPAMMAGLDLFVLPSLAEGISNTILEAMSCGVPAVATRVGGNAELIDDGVTGALVPSDDSEALARTICDYVTDPTRVSAEGIEARRRVVYRFSIDTMLARYTELYDDLLATRGRPARDVAGETRQAVGGSR